LTGRAPVVKSAGAIRGSFVCLMVVTVSREE
jgi:hypothetical protein